jgi:hypothetical protein
MPEERHHKDDRRKDMRRFKELVSEPPNKALAIVLMDLDIFTLLCYGT